ncbi:MAG: hypothetical protein AABX64_00510 [Nanoarchaeota archaeon]
MESELKLWEIVIRYDAHHIDGTAPLKKSYRVIGIDKEEALEKARSLFCEQEWKGKELVENARYISREVTLDNYRESIREYRKKIPAPEMNDPNAQKFKLTPRISDDGRSIEFIVNEKP